MAADPAVISTRVLTILGFASILLSFLALQWSARRTEGRVPRAGDCFGHLMRPPLGRVMFIVAWWWIGWHFLAR